MTGSSSLTPQGEVNCVKGSGQDGETRACGLAEGAGAEEREGLDAGKLVMDAPLRGSARPCGLFEERSVRWTAPMSATSSPPLAILSSDLT